MKDFKDFIIPDRDFGTPAAKSKQLVTLEIDGFEVTVPEGTSIMRAAAEIGISVPKLCATDSLDAFGSCRLCLVEIEGRNGTPASCTTPVAPGLKVKTQTGKLKDLRRGVMELYISDHPLDCLTCAANGDCELQDMAGAVGLRDVRFDAIDTHFRPKNNSGEANPQWLPKDDSNPYFTYPSAPRPTMRWPATASAAAPACRPARPRPCRKNRSSRSAPPTGRSSPLAPIAGWDAASRPRCAGMSWSE
jgi:formate dehydrogenase major subunit